MAIMLLTIVYFTSKNIYRDKERLVTDFVYDIANYSISDLQYHEGVFPHRKSMFEKYFFDSVDNHQFFISGFDNIVYLDKRDFPSKYDTYSSILTEYELDFRHYESDDTWVVYIPISYDIHFSEGEIISINRQMTISLLYEDDRYYIDIVKLTY